MHEKIISVEELDPFDVEYVYDLVMEDESQPYFYADGVLVHNSCYFSIENLIGDVPEDEKPALASAIADDVVGQVNDAFKTFMTKAFMVQPGYDDLIKAAREVVAASGIFLAKKKYILRVVDMEGKKIEAGSDKEIKTQGSDLKVSTTPPIIKKFLREVILMKLHHRPISDINKKVLEFRRRLIDHDQTNPLDLANVTSVKKLEEYVSQYEAIEKRGRGRVNMPGQVRATINYNEFIREHKITSAQEITSGSKIKIVWLKKNDYNFKSIAIPSDIESLPQWFKDHFEIDVQLTESKMIDQKLENNLYGPIGEPVPTEQSEFINSIFGFE